MSNESLPDGQPLVGQASSFAIDNGTLLKFDHVVNDMSEADLLFIRAPDGADLLGLTLVNKKGQPPRLSHSHSSAYVTVEYQLERVDDRTYDFVGRLSCEPHPPTGDRSRLAGRDCGYFVVIDPNGRLPCPIARTEIGIAPSSIFLGSAS